jgi:excinuclease ABC subunit C
LLSTAIEETELLAEALCQKAGHRVEIAVPQRGEKRELVEAALQNARETLGRKLADTASQTKLLSVLGQAVGASGPIRRVEVYDNSHIMGTNAIGAMIVAGPAGFMKTHYRTFNIRSEELTPGDDYGMMREVLRRRFSRLLKEAPREADPHPEELRSSVSKDGPHAHPLPSFETPLSAAPQDEGDPVAVLAEKTGNDPDAFPAWPDLVLIDGGRGQFDAARQVFADLGVTGVTLVSMAKGRDRDAGRESFFVEGREPFHLPPRDPALYFAERLRDEAHRFAIGTHRARRKREFTKSPLDEIGGIGPARKRALLQSFGTAKAISRAALADLEKVPGINAATARLVYDYFHERR